MDKRITHLRLLDGRSVPTDELKAWIGRTLEKAQVAGLSCAIINDSQVAYYETFGYMNRSAGVRNNEKTVFAAASIGKSVFAYLVMLLVEEEIVNLDKPLNEYLAKPLCQYPGYAELEGNGRYKRITARMVLSHSTGFPNLRSLEPDGRLKFLFSPGERHFYSGEGITLLQMVIEEITGKDLETLAQERIFQPLGMTLSSYVWQPVCEANTASPHDEFSRPRGLPIQFLQNMQSAGGSMATTAADLARFISLGILNVAGKRKATIDEMLRPQIAIHYKSMFGPGAWQETDQYHDIHLAWGLGWGRFDTPFGRAFFHTGHGLGWQNYTVTYADKGIGIVLLSNSDNFESVAQEIAEKAIGDVHTPFGWLGYIPFDPSRPKASPPPDPVAIEVDPAILESYAGTYGIQKPVVLIQTKFEDSRLWILSQDGKNWNRLLAETEARFFVHPDEPYRFEFIRAPSGNVIALRMEILGVPLLTAPKMLSQ
ncbi:MAG: serine hydrolase [Anaerolineae bacterium]|nr:serine hydrolase [Anaerolineae bacterium]